MKLAKVKRIMKLAEASEDLLYEVAVHIPKDELFTSYESFCKKCIARPNIPRQLSYDDCIAVLDDKLRIAYDKHMLCN